VGRWIQFRTLVSFYKLHNAKGYNKNNRIP